MSHFSVLDTVQQVLEGALHRSFPNSTGCEVVRTKDPLFGDYQCNSAMRLAKQYGKSPRLVAQGIVDAMRPEERSLFSSIEVAGPGFINLTLSPRYFASLIYDAIQTNVVISPISSPQKIIIDFSSPNIAKEMHVGHLRSTIIGDCLARIFEAKGHTVIRLNHVGDWGTAFGMLIAHITSQADFAQERLASYTLQDLMRFYKEGKVRFDQDPVFRRQAQAEVVRLQSGDPQALRIWRVICDISEAAYQQIYDLLDIRIITRGESFYNSWLPETVAELEKKGLIEVSDGAKCLYLEGFTNKEGDRLPLMLQKSDGGYNYDTTDMAALIHRIREERADRIIYVTDSGQSTHFEMLFAAAQKAGLFDERMVRVDHVPFGLVLGPDGKKFKTRSGETERLIDLITRAIEHARRLLIERNPSWTVEEQEQAAQILGIGAIKYADLSCNRLSDYTFSYDRMLRFEGNTAAFIMYAYVRSESILRKIGYVASTKQGVDDFQPAELSLAKRLCQFPEVLDEIMETLLPNRLTDYLYSLSEEFNLFFRDCHVQGDPREQERAQLVHLTNRTLRQGMELLGIRAPARM